MAISKETNEWLESLSKEGNLSAEVIAQLRLSAESNPKADEFIKGSALRQSDYSRKSAELQAARQDFERTQAELKARELAVTKFQTELGDWKTGADKQVIEAQKARELAETKAQAALSRLQRIGVQYGVAEEDLKLEGTDVQIVKPNPVADIDTSRFVTKEDISKGTQEAAILDAMIYDLGEEHRELFGTRLPKPAQLVQEAIAAGKSITALWEEKYKVGDKRKEIAENAIQERIRQGVEAEKVKWASAQSLPGAHLQGVRDDLHGAPVLKEGGIPAPTSEGGGISAAIAAFQSGKYKQTR